MITGIFVMLTFTLVAVLILHVDHCQRISKLIKDLDLQYGKDEHQ